MNTNVEKLSRMQKMLDLLVEEIEERLHAKAAAAPLKEPVVVLPAIEPETSSIPHLEEGGEPRRPPDESQEPTEIADELRLDVLPPASMGPSHAARLMARLALGLLVLIIAVNIPFDRHGTTLATALPDSTSLIIRDGLVIKEENSEEIYVYGEGAFRWISSLDAFEHHGFTWGDVHVVQDGYLSGFEVGSPLHVLLKCAGSPHIYRLEGGAKRWIRDIDTFIDEGPVWEDVRSTPCIYLRDLPDGETIPPDSGPPPQP